MTILSGHNSMKFRRKYFSSGVLYFAFCWKKSSLNKCLDVSESIEVTAVSFSFLFFFLASREVYGLQHI